MGGRGSSYSRSVTGRQMRITLQGTQTQQQQQIAGPAGNALPDDDDNTPATPSVPDVTAISQMDDSQLAALVQTAQTTDLPNHLNDTPNLTQRFVYAAGLNAKPTVLDATAFANFMQQNNISQSEIIARSVKGAQYTSGGLSYNLTDKMVNQMLVHSKLNYIGGKVGGSAYGCGSYFAQTGGANTGYGNATITAVLNPSTARVIQERQLRRMATQYAKTHPQFAKAVGTYTGSTWGTSTQRNNMSIYALALGYNVISDGTGPGTYYNVIDRSALVVRE